MKASDNFGSFQRSPRQNNIHVNFNANSKQFKRVASDYPRFPCDIIGGIVCAIDCRDNICLPPINVIARLLVGLVFRLIAVSVTPQITSLNVKLEVNKFEASITQLFID